MFDESLLLHYYLLTGKISYLCNKVSWDVSFIEVTAGMKLNC